MRKLTLILLLSALFVLTSADFEDIIMKIKSVSTDPNLVGSSYKSVSLQGGTYIYIKGTGFSHRSAASNRVTLDGDYDCPIVEFLTTNTMVVCEAPAFPKEKSVTVRVFSDDERVDSCTNCITYSYWSTPQLVYMLPNAANPGAEVKYYGRQRVSSTLDVDYVKIGEDRCDPSSQNEFDAFTFDGNSNIQAPCNVPKLDAGFYQVSQKNLKSTGYAKKLNTVPVYRFGADPYDFAVVPRIDSISSSKGSTEGQIITVRGAGFGDDTQVNLADTSCKIIKKTATEIKCELQPRTSAIPAQGYHSGLKFETFKDKDISAVRAGTLTPTTKGSRLVAEIPLNAADGYASKLSGYFKAPVTGNYRFVLSADDKAELYMALTPDSTSGVADIKTGLSKVVAVDSYTPYKFYFNSLSTSQISADIALEAGKFYYMELYHQEATGADFATVGVMIPDTLNDINTKPDVQSIKINCPADLEVIEFKLTGPTSGTWNIKLDYLNPNGKKIDKTLTTGDISYDATETAVANQIRSTFGYTTSVVKKMYKSDGSVTAISSQANVFAYEVTFKSLRKNGVLPGIIAGKLVGAKSVGVAQLVKPSDPLKGTFTISVGSKSVEVSYSGANLESKLRELGFQDPIRIIQLGEAELGSEWRIQFSGENTGAIEPLSIQHTLEGCKNPEEITVPVTKLQEGSRDLFYETIPFDHLFTAHDKSQITLKSNGITANCPAFNCDYEVVSTNLPQIKTASYTGTLLMLTIGTPFSATKEKVKVFFGNIECSTLAYSSSTGSLSATCATPEGGDFIPRVHFEGLGYATVAATLSPISIPTQITSVNPTSINKNGGTVLTIAGKGFPASLAAAQERPLAVKIGSSSCVASSVTPTQIKCTTSAVDAEAPLSVVLNGKTVDSASSLTFLAVVPEITDVTPDSVNPVLQTDITITGTNFDASYANTKIYLASASNPTVQECLISSGTTTQLVCKLLGAPTGNYKLTVRTSLGYANPIDFTVQTVVTSISPSAGSTAGGTTLTIQGGSFSNDIQQTLVFIGDKNVQCDVISSTENEVKCITRAKDTSYASDSAQGVVVTTRIVEESVCQNGGDSCSFKYSDALTPQVTALDKTEVVSGNTLTITGTGFDNTLTVTLGGVNCVVSSSSSTEIVITVPNEVIPSKSAALVINVAGKGNARFSSGPSPLIQVKPTISAISPKIGSTAGVLLTIAGSGFQDGVVVKVGTSACQIQSRTLTEITCKATIAGEVSLSYGEFTEVKCAAASACTLALSASKTPAVTAAAPLTPSSGTFTLTITGTNFALGAITVHLVSKKDTTVSFQGSLDSNSATQIVASFSNVPAGSYSLQAVSGGNIASASSITVTVPLSASVSSAVDSSLAGGVTLSISGAGFFGNSNKDKNQVTVCGLPCQVTASTETSIQCKTPTFINSAVQTAYPNLAKASILKPSSTWSDLGSGAEKNVFDLAFTTIYTTASANCEIGLDIGAGLLGEVTEIKFFPDPAITSSKLADSVIEGSNDKSTYTTIATIDANAHDGWNTIRIDTPTPYRYFRLRGATSTAKCALAEFQLYGITLSNNAATDLNAIACTASVTVNDQTQTTASTAVNYKQSNTAVLNSISPDLGSTAGNTELTLTGSGFGNVPSQVKVYIDDIECTVQTVVDTEITCKTGPAPSISNRRSSLESELRIELSGKGNAIVNNIKYFYVDRWSEITTWGGISPPREGESVSIPAGQTILLDMSPPKLRAIIIEGALIFDDANINLDCDYIIIRNGRMQIGTWEKPIQNKVTVTLYGTKESPQLPTFGNKVIAMMEGILDIHGKPRSHTWTVLDTTAAAGESTIVVKGAVDWQEGEQIVIASTEHDHYQSETRSILAVVVDTPSAGLTTLILDDILQYKHYAGVQTIDGETFEMRAEVGLLTRNVVIQGDESSTKMLYGCHIMSHSSTGDDSSIGRISYTEVRRAGQAYNLGRYPIHFHLIGNVRESYVIGNAIHHTFNRAITIHGVHFLKIQNNVAYWVMGHTIFIEDGIETHNVIEDNLVINTIASTALLNTDQTPASFWITNPNNIWRRNHAAGSDRYGFWFDLREHPEGPSATTTICPTGEKLGEFLDNQAHSSGRYGLRIFHELIPRTFPCQPYDDYEANPPIQAEFKNFLGWKNMRDAVIGERLGAVKFKNIKAADNLRAGIEISDGNWSPPDTLLVEDAWIVGFTPENKGEPEVYRDHVVRGLITPKKDFFLAKNVHFSNFQNSNFDAELGIGETTTAIETCSHCEHPAATDAGARTAFFEGLTFNNVDKRVTFNVPFKEILVDRDGSLVGTPGNAGVVTFYYEHLDVPGCHRDEPVYNGLVCDQTVTVRRIEFLGLLPFGSFEMMDLEIFRKEDNPDEKYGAIPYRAQTRKSWAVPFVTGYSYNLNWFSRADFAELVMAPSEVIRENDKAITLVWNHTEYRETFDVAYNTDKTLIENTTTLWDRAGANSQKCGDWHHDVENQLLYVAVNGIEKTDDFKIKAVKCRESCPVPGAAQPKDGIRLWSNATQWPNQRVPQDGDNVEIPASWLVILDQNTAKLNTLIIKGDLYFDSTKDDLVLTAERVWVQGQMFIGNSSNERHTKKAKVLLTGVRKSEVLLLDEFSSASNKVLAVTGNLTMYGEDVDKTYVRLLASVNPGATKIKVPADTNWKVGDDIVIAPSQRSETEFETRTIVAISNGEITLDKGVSYYHFGAATTTKTTTYGTIDMRTEIGLLTRNIVIEGTDEDAWGGRVFVGEVYSADLDYYFRGKADLDNVEMKNLGQKDNDQAGLTFDRLTADTNGASNINKCTMRDSLAYEVRVIKSDGITFTDNVFYKSYKYQIVFEDENSNIQFKRNLVIGNQDRGLKTQAGDNAFDFSSSIMAKTNFVNSEISDNIVAGCFQTCYTVNGGDCSVQSTGPYTMKNNVAHSGETGWLLHTPSPKCNSATHYTGYKLDQGIATMFKSAQIKASNIMITDTRIGMHLNTGGVLGYTSMILENSYVAGLSLTAYPKKSECSNIAGVYIPVGVTGAKTIPPTPSMLPWYKVKSDHIFQSAFTIKGVTFADFNENLAGCSNNFAIQTNHYASDNSAQTTISGVTLSNVGAENKVNFVEPDDAWIGIDDCGGYYCTGITNVLIQDDGTLLGKAKPAALIPKNRGVFDSANCRESEKQNAYICENIGWGVLTFESMDIDVMTRILSPVKVTTTGFTNTMNSYMDHVWDGFYTGLKRYSRFHSVVQTGKDYQMTMTGTVPNGVRWQLHGAKSTESLTAEYGYATPQSVKILKEDGTEVRPKIAKTPNEKLIADTDACGTNVYNLDTRKITIKLTGEDSCKLEVVLINSVKATIRYDITIEEFFRQDGPAAFIDKVAAILKINPASIRIVDVKSGSSIVTVTVAANNQGTSEEDTAAAQAELEAFTATLRAAVDSGELRILDSAILDSSFETNLIRTEMSYVRPSEETPQNATETIISGSDMTFIIIAAVVAGIALIVGAYFAHLKYRRSKVAPLQVTELKKIPSQSSIQKIQDTFIDSPLARLNTRTMSVSPSPTTIISPSLIVDISPTKRPEGEKDVFEYKL